MLTKNVVVVKEMLLLFLFLFFVQWNRLRNCRQFAQNQSSFGERVKPTQFMWNHSILHCGFSHAIIFRPSSGLRQMHHTSTGIFVCTPTDVDTNGGSVWMAIDTVWRRIRTGAGRRWAVVWRRQRINPGCVDPSFWPIWFAPNMAIDRETARVTIKLKIK